MGNYFRNADEQRTHGSREELQEYLDFCKEGDRWVTPYGTEVTMVLMDPENELFKDAYKSDFSPTPEKPDMVASGVEDEQGFEDAFRSTGMLAVFPLGNKMVAYPVIWTAEQGVYGRAGLYGPTIANNVETARRRHLQNNLRASWLTQGINLLKGRVVLLLRDGVVSGFNSDEYAVLPVYEAIPILEKKLKEDRPDATYVSGMVNHEFLMAEYDLKDPAASDGLSQILKKAGQQVDSLTACVRFSTSDTAAAMLQATPYYVLNGVPIRLGKGTGIKHTGNATMENWEKSLDSLGMLFKECEDQVEKLGNTVINHPAGCLQRVAEKARLPITATREVVERMLLRFAGKTGCYAIDVYLALNEIVDLACKNENYTPKKVLDLSEEVAKCLNIKFEYFDAPYVDPDNE